VSYLTKKCPQCGYDNSAHVSECILCKHKLSSLSSRKRLIDDSFGLRQALNDENSLRDLEELIKNLQLEELIKNLPYDKNKDIYLTTLRKYLQEYLQVQKIEDSEDIKFLIERHSRNPAYQLGDSSLRNIYKSGAPSSSSSSPMSLSSYGSAYRGGGGSRGCFIATAAFGSHMAKEVNILRQFRDRYLLTNSIGRIFVASYYKLSPRFAEYIKGHVLIAKVIRVVLYPVVKLCKTFFDQN
jgi:hypothetical protein